MYYIQLLYNSLILNKNELIKVLILRKHIKIYETKRLELVLRSIVTAPSNTIVIIKLYTVVIITKAFITIKEEAL